MKTPFDPDLDAPQGEVRAGPGRDLVRDIAGLGIDKAGQRPRESVEPHYPVTPAPEAVVRLHGSIVAARDPYSDQAEEFRALRAQLLGSAFPRGGRRALAVVSPDEGDGKSYLVANLAVSFCETGGRTLLVDANFRAPALDGLLGMAREPGLADLLAGLTEHDPVSPVDGVPGLHFLPVGLPVEDPILLLQSARLPVVLRRFIAQFDHVLIDTPASRLAPDARLLAAHAGAALVVGRRDRSRVAAMQRLLAQLQAARTVLGGVVLNQP